MINQNDVLSKAASISDIRERYIYVYDNLFKYLDEIWNINNPCQFCNNQCIATRKGANYHEYDGYCYSFEYDNSFFSKSFIKNIRKCKHLGNNKHCTTQNISCKLYVCSYLKKNKKFNINTNDILLLKKFFNKKQQLILKYNFFKTKEEIIDKLLEDDSSPYPIYWLFNKYRIR